MRAASLSGALWLIVGASLCLSCSDDGDAPPCVDGSESCGQSCDGDPDCAAGLYCASGTCAKACNIQAGIACPDGLSCQLQGRCVVSGGPGSPLAGAGGAGAGGGEGGAGAPSGPVGGGGAGGNAGSGTGGSGGVCASQDVRATQTTPTVVLVIDQSSSMDESFEGQGSRWDVLRQFLLEAPGGLIAELQEQVRFGLALYSAESGSDNLPVGECPRLTTVAPELNNYDAINDVYADADTIEETPTGDALDALIDELGLENQLDNDGEPVVFILATDGEPDRCEALNPQNGQEEVIAAVDRAFTLGARTFTIWIGQLNDDGAEQHVQDVANHGLGRRPGDPDAEYWVAGDDASLRDALRSIVGGELSCEIQLDGRVQEDDACRGDVLLNSTQVPCDDPNGWEWVDEGTIRLLGSACDMLMNSSSATLSVSFPCDVPILE